MIYALKLIGQELNEMDARIQEKTLNDPKIEFREKLRTDEEDRHAMMHYTDEINSIFRESLKDLHAKLMFILWVTPQETDLYARNGITIQFPMY
jgi:hypothetical protein